MTDYPIQNKIIQFEKLVSEVIVLKETNSSELRKNEIEFQLSSVQVFSAARRFVCLVYSISNYTQNILPKNSTN